MPRKRSRKPRSFPNLPNRVSVRRLKDPTEAVERIVPRRLLKVEEQDVLIVRASTGSRVGRRDNFELRDGSVGPIRDRFASFEEASAAGERVATSRKSRLFFAASEYDPPRLLADCRDLVAGRAAVLTRSLNRTPAHVPLWIDTDPGGRIVDLAPGALQLIRYSRKFALGRDLVRTLVTGRPEIDQLLRVVFNGASLERIGSIRPRDRRAIPVRYTITPAPQSTERDPVLRWTFVRLHERGA